MINDVVLAFLKKEKMFVNSANEIWDSESVSLPTEAFVLRFFKIKD